MRTSIVEFLRNITIQHNVQLNIAAVWELIRGPQKNDVNYVEPQFRALKEGVNNRLEPLAHWTMLDRIMR